MSKMVMRRLLFCTFALGIAANALAETYSWEDKDGLHFTDDLSTVPARVRKKLRKEQVSQTARSVEETPRPSTEPPPRAEREGGRPEDSERESLLKEWKKLVSFTPPPGYVASPEPGNCGISRNGLVYAPAKSSNSDDGWITLAFMDGRLADPAIARRAGLPPLTINSLLEGTRKEVAGGNGRVKLGSLSGRQAVVATSKGGHNRSAMKEYRLLCGIRIFEVRIAAATDAKVQELDGYVQGVSLNPGCCDYRGE